MIQRLACPITGQPATVIFSRPYRHPDLWKYAGQARLEGPLADADFEIRYCAASGLHFQTWVMAPEELGNWYSAAAYQVDFPALIAAEKLYGWAHQAEEILVFRQLCRSRPPRVLDFGAGWGKWAAMAVAYGCDVTCVEVSREAAAFLAGRGFRLATIGDLPADGFDFINADQVFEHLADPLAVTRILAASLKPGGWLKVSTPDDPRLPGRLRRMQAAAGAPVPDAAVLNSLHPLDHINLFTAASLRRLAAEAGLRSFRPPLLTWLGAGQLWNIPRQFNRNLVVPWKRWLRRGTYQWFQRGPD